jgi:hypothetical protein
MLVQIFINDNIIYVNFDNKLINNYNEDLKLYDAILDDEFICELYNECAEAYPNNNWYDIVCDRIEYYEDHIKAYVSTFSNTNSDVNDNLLL